MLRSFRILSGTLLLGAIGLAVSCTTPEANVRRIYHDFGNQNSFERTGTSLASIPMWVSYEFRHGGGQVVGFLVGIVDQTGDEFGRTAGNIFGGPAYLIADSKRHVGLLAETWEISFSDPTARDFSETGSTLVGWPGDLVEEFEFRGARLGEDLGGIASGEVQRTKTFFGEVWDFLTFMLW